MVRTRISTDDILLRHRIATATLLMRAAQLGMLLSKAGFRPDLPRMPRGLPHGGRWVRVGGDWEGIDTLTTGSLPEGAPKVPDEPPPSTRDKNQVARSVARYMFFTPAFDLLAEVAGWLKEHAGIAIVAYLEPAKPLKELQAAISEPKDGYQIHHIVEQEPARKDGFPETKINAPENLVRIPNVQTLRDIRMVFDKNEEFGNLTPREFLRGQRWEARVSVGLFALKKHGVLKP